MEKRYSANSELVDLIITKGQIEILSDSRLDRKIGKKFFKKSTSSKAEIYFDYDNIKLNYGDIHLCSSYSFNEKEIDFLLNYSSNSSLRKKLAVENFTNSFYDLEKIEKELLERITLYKNIDSQKRKIDSWKKTIKDLNNKNQ